jgi:single-strand DNA-binding protein
MASFNKITIVGYLGRDVELRYTGQGTAVASTSIATTEKRKEGGESQEITTWFKLTFWSKLAEIANEYLKKGSQLYVTGTLRQTEFTDRDGNKRTSLEVNVSDMQMLGTKGESNVTRDGARQAMHAAANKAQAPSNGGFTGADESDIPF